MSTFTRNVLGKMFVLSRLFPSEEKQLNEAFERLEAEIARLKQEAGRLAEENYLLQKSIVEERNELYAA